MGCRKLVISKNGRYFTDADGNPFFYLADTAWRLFKQLNQSEATEYLINRAEKGFTVIQAYVLRGLNVRNIYGDLPLIDGDIQQPNEAFFKNIDFIVDKAEELGLWMGLVTTFGEHIRREEVEGEIFRNNESIFDPLTAYTYGKFLGNRYKEKPVLWIFGGDRKPEGSEKIWRAMAAGLKEGFGAGQLITYHGPGDPQTPSSSYWFHKDEWLDFNTIQSGHGWAIPNYEYVQNDYFRIPVKPTLDMEARYEDCPDVTNKSGKRIDSHQVREAAYWAMLAGAAGHGYGCCGVWEFNSNNLQPDYTFNYQVYRGTKEWRQAMNSDGAFQMGIMRRFFEQYPWYKIIPDNSLVLEGQGEGENHVQAAKAEDGSFLLAYLPLGGLVTLKMDSMAKDSVRAQWFNPRNGEFKWEGQYYDQLMKKFTSPTKGEKEDWVLVLEIF